MPECEYCCKQKALLEFEELSFVSWGNINDNTKTGDLEYRKEIIFIDRKHLRKADPKDCECIDHGENIKINYCPMCGIKLEDTDA